MAHLYKIHEFQNDKISFTRIINDFLLTVSSELQYGVSYIDKSEYLKRSAKVLSKLKFGVIKNEKHLRERIIEAQRLYGIYDKTFKGTE